MLPVWAALVLAHSRMAQGNVAMWRLPASLSIARVRVQWRMLVRGPVRGDMPPAPATYPDIFEQNTIRNQVVELAGPQT